VVVALQPTAGNEQQKILKVIDSLEAGGETPGGYALKTAYSLIQPRVLRGGNNRIILATDGDFNVGEITEEALMQLVAQKQQSGVYLTCIGVGMGNYKDSKLEALAKKGNGNFAYFDNIMEAEKILVTECMQTFYISAADAFMNMSFNAHFVKQYRLIGYDNRKDVLADSAVTMEGGEMGSGHTVTAVFEFEPAADVTSMNAPVATAEFSFVPYGSVQKNNELFPFYASYFPIATVDSSYRFAASIALFGQLLRRSVYVSKAHWQTLVDMLPSSVDATQYLQKEFQLLVVKAKEIYNPVKKKRSWFKRRE
jgi:Ca-activated chloride channel homolog